MNRQISRVAAGVAPSASRTCRTERETMCTISDSIE
jgi:hypothetical protein